jgi:hypothetical protein
MAGLPGIGTVLGVGAAILYRMSDPRRKEEQLLRARKKITSRFATPDSARRLGIIDDELTRVREEINRRVS